MNYGTIFVDQSTHRVIDIINSRNKEDIINYLKKFPNLEKVTRDGAIIYKNAIESVNPNIVQISDKFHLIKNLIDAIKNDLKVHMKKNVVYKEDIYDLSNYQFNFSKDEKKRIEKYKAKQKLIDEIRKDYNKGLSTKELEIKYDCYFKTIKRYLKFDSTRVITTKTTEIDKYSSQIYESLKENLNFHQIYKQIEKLGYSSTYQNFFKQLKIRLITNTLGNTYQLSRHNFYKLLYDNDLKRLKLDDENTDSLKEYFNKDNQESRILEMIKNFRNIFINQKKEDLDNWIEQYKNDEYIKKFEYLQTFIKGLINDKEAVIGQIENTITNGLVEGKVCKLKLKKRSTYGRNSFELLRCLILQE